MHSGTLCSTSRSLAVSQLQDRKYQADFPHVDFQQHIRQVLGYEISAGRGLPDLFIYLHIYVFGDDVN